MSSLFGEAKKGAPSLTESIFGTTASSSASASSDLFAMKPNPATNNRPSRSQKRQRVTSTEDTQEEEEEETLGETIERRTRQSQDKLLDNFTLSLKDYGDAEDDATSRDELYADVRGLMKHYGLVIIRDALSSEDVEKMTQLADATQGHICETLDRKKIPYDSPVNDTETIRFQELAVRCKGRMDVRYTKDEKKDNVETNELPPLALIEGLAASILHGAEPPNLVYAGWIFSFPGSSNQPWHSDGSPLFDSGTESLPSYAINVFYGLHPLEKIELGPTEFVVGSHHMTPDDAMAKVDTAISAVLGKGDILIYDYRICHRGTSNLREDKEKEACGSEIRKVLYLMYARPWLKEHLNFGEQSLFE